MANSLVTGAEFNSFEDFEQALKNYCDNTRVNGKPIEFTHLSLKYIPNDTFESAKQQRLVYQWKSERCKLKPSTGCPAEYKLVLHTKSNDNHVLQLDRFDDNHNNHAEFVDAKLPAHKKSTTNSNDKLTSILKKIMDQCGTMPQPNLDGYAEIFGNFLKRINENVTFKVEFTDYPSGFGEWIC